MCDPETPRCSPIGIKIKSYASSAHKSVIHSYRDFRSALHCSHCLAFSRGHTGAEYSGFSMMPQFRNPPNTARDTVERILEALCWKLGNGGIIEIPLYQHWRMLSNFHKHLWRFASDECNFSAPCMVRVAVNFNYKSTRCRIEIMLSEKLSPFPCSELPWQDAISLANNVRIFVSSESGKWNVWAICEDVLFFSSKQKTFIFLQYSIGHNLDRAFRNRKKDRILGI